VQELSILEGPHRLVVGGGIGSGKSVVTGLLAERGVVVIEADAIGRQVIEPGGRAFAGVAGRWPEVVVRGEIDRAALAAIVFADPGELAELEAISHPAIATEIAIRATTAGSAPVAVEVPVLAPIVGEGWVHVWVSAAVETRIARAVARGMQEGDVRRRVASQASDAEWAAWADHVLVNEGTEAELAEAIEDLIRFLSRAG
jgi:dephospho-CoA kinase